MAVGQRGNFSMIPNTIPNWIANSEQLGLATFEKISPVTGVKLWDAVASQHAEVTVAVDTAAAAQSAWAAMPGVQRGLILHRLADLLQQYGETFASVIAQETGKSVKDARGEVAAAVQVALFYASEGQRLYGRTTTSAQPNRLAMTVRRPRGIAALIIAANTPLANVAWKVFPALICGNAAILKASEDAPAVAWFFGKLAAEAGVPSGVLAILQGRGSEAGEPLVCDSRVRVISFTGSTAVGRRILEFSCSRLARVSLELGGKNALVVCDDADLDEAVRWAVLSAFSNAGQRCAAASRLIVFEAVYEEFKKRLLARTSALRVGASDEDDLGPVINFRQLDRMVAAIDAARERGVTVLLGGKRMYDRGCFMAPTILENVAHDDPLNTEELFGPITCLHRVSDFSEALAMTNDSPYGLTAAIHTKNVHRAMIFADQADVGVVTVNGGTFGSEPHMPFGGTKLSGNGTREPGTEALEVYSELRDIYLNLNPAQL